MNEFYNSLLRIRDPSSARASRNFLRTGYLCSAAFDPNPRYLLTGCDERSAALRLWVLALAFGRRPLIEEFDGEGLKRLYEVCKYTARPSHKVLAESPASLFLAARRPT